MPLYVQNGNLLKKAGALGTSAGCCCVNCGEETRLYSYFDSVPPAPAFEDCPNYSDCNGLFIYGWFYSSTVPNRVGQAGPGDCAGNILSCYVRSVDFPIGCVLPHATVYAGSGLDDYGVIYGWNDYITVVDPCPSSDLGRVAATTTITPYSVDNGDGTQYLKLNVSVINQPNRAGPYGVASLSVRWWFG
jgi:hypothetical protein